MPELTPEEKARGQIDKMLAACDWVVQSKASINLSAARGVAICELTFATGEPDYTLFVDGKASRLRQSKCRCVSFGGESGHEARRRIDQGALVEWGMGQHRVVCSPERGIRSASAVSTP